jgi:hypothetical protein
MGVGRQKKMKATTRWLWVGKKRKKVDFSNRSNKNEHKLNGNPKKRPKKRKRPTYRETRARSKGSQLYD